jgi:hypothetical protein
MTEHRAKPGLGIRHGDDHVVEEPDADVVYSFMVRQRLRETAEDAWLEVVARCIAEGDHPADASGWRRLRQSAEQMFALVVDRLRYATRQGDAGSQHRLVAEAGEVGRARKQAASAPSEATAERLRACYLELAATSIVLAERCTRPPELRRGRKSSTNRHRALRFWTPNAAELEDLLAVAAEGPAA